MLGHVAMSPVWDNEMRSIRDQLQHDPQFMSMVSTTNRPIIRAILVGTTLVIAAYGLMGGVITMPSHRCHEEGGWWFYQHNGHLFLTDPPNVAGYQYNQNDALRCVHPQFTKQDLGGRFLETACG